MPIVNRVADLQPDIQAWRRDIHEHPELLYDVHRTAAFVADRLREFGCDEVATARLAQVGIAPGGPPANGLTTEFFCEQARFFCERAELTFALADPRWSCRASNCLVARKSN